MQREGSANEVLAQNDAQMMDTVMEGVGMAAGGVAQGYNDGTFGGGGGPSTEKIRRQAGRAEKKYLKSVGGGKDNLTGLRR